MKHLKKFPAELEKFPIEEVCEKIQNNMRVSLTSNCILWIGSYSGNSSKNYLPKMGIEVKKCKGYINMRRFIAALFDNFDYNSNLLVCHSCDTPLCVNVKHFFYGTQEANMMDANKKGRLFNRGKIMSEEEEAEAIKLIEKRILTREKIAAIFGVEKRTLYRLYKEYKEFSVAK